jgi:ATP-dependent exoDNAse (exonuclease V) beta subunit
MSIDVDLGNLDSDHLIALDAINRVRALDHASFIVEAPAGAGKTELLTQRYLKLLATVRDPEEIIALTFTNKAATEMRNRILLSLEHAERQTVETAPHKLITRALANAVLAQSKANAWDVIAQPSRLRILTIDALCSSLTRQMPLLSKFGGQPAVSDDTDSHYIEAARRAIAHIVHESVPQETRIVDIESEYVESNELESDDVESEGAVTVALRYLDNNSEKLTSLLAKMLARRDQWLPLAVQLHGAQAEEVSHNTSIALQCLMAEHLQLALKILTPNVQRLLMPIARYAASNLEADADIAPLLDWQTVLEANAENLLEWQALANFLVTKSEKTYRKSLNKNNGFPVSDEGKTYKQAYLDVVNTLESSQAVASVLGLPALAKLAENEAVIQSLTKLLMLASTHLWAVFQAAGEVDFVAIAQSAQLALENEQGATDLALKLDYKISHLLIDEFQDTSPVQMRLIEKLIEGWQPDDGRTLFCVGDPMQSIYRFRKADVSLFLQASEYGIGHLPLTRLQLSSNNRSHPAVVSWINDAFKQVFPTLDNINQGAISYRAFTATRPTIEDEGVIVHPLVLAADGAVDENSYDESNADENRSVNIKQIEASYVADLIVTLRAKNDTQTMAVLVRNRSHLKELVSEIRRNHSHLKFQAVEIERLNDRQTIQDAFSLACALSHRADRLHWLNVLRAPWCGLTLADLHVLAADNHRATVWQLMQDEARLNNLSEDGQLRLRHVNTVLKAAFAGQGRMPARRWLESTWMQLGGAKCLVDVGDNRDVQVFFDLVEKTSRSGYMDIAALELGMQKLYAKPDIDAPDNLQFLTIHKSKGLEFDTVILPALNRQPRNTDNELVLWQEVMVNQQSYLIAAPLTSKVISATSNTKNATPSVYDFLKSLEKERADNEIVRLLYVAATRAQRQLHVIASVQMSQKGEVKPLANSLLQSIWPALEADFMRATPLSINATEASMIDVNQFKPQLQRLYSQEFTGNFLELNAEVAARKLSQYRSQNDVDTSLALKQSGLLVEADLYKNCGILAHLYMQLFAKTDLQSWREYKLAQCQSAMQQWLMQQGHTAKHALQGATQVQTALQTTLNSHEGQWVLQAHTDAVSELSLMQLTDDGVRSHVIDRTFIENGSRWIVDYKLTQLDQQLDGGMNLTLLAAQHRPQLERYASLFVDEKLPIKKAVLFLSMGELVELIP